jgi:hypothetical protein
MIRKIWYLCLVVVCSLVCACSPSAPEEDTYPVSGTVTFDGEPLADGEIQFVTPTTGALDIVSISGGNFQGEAKAGLRRVQISAFREGEPMAPMPGAKPEPTRINYIPAEYNAMSKLEANVTPDGPNQFEFELFSTGGEGAPASDSGAGTAPADS